VADPAPTSPAGLSPHLTRRRALRAATADSPLAAVPMPACAGEHSWRSGPNPRSGAELGCSLNQLDEANRRAVALAEETREAEEVEGTPIVINGVVGPRGDGYDSDVLRIFTEACDQLGVQWRQLNATNVSVARRESVARLDELAGPKTQLRRSAAGPRSRGTRRRPRGLRPRRSRPAGSRAGQRR